MRLKLIISMACAMIFLYACQGQPPTQIVLVVTATQMPDQELTPTQEVLVQSTQDAIAQSVPTMTTTQIPPTAELPPTVTPTNPATATPQGYPAPINQQIYVAEQRFERGRMFWLEPVDQIWVLTTNNEGKNLWSVYNDTFEEGEPETDPSIDEPEGFFQPERGFGKVWRENPEIRENLGWAIESEFGHSTTYEYHAGGTVTAQNVFIRGAGYHLLTSLYNEVIRFNEGQWNWEILRDLSE